MGETFSFNTKLELCKLPCENDCCAIAECYGMLLFGNTFNKRKIKLVTENKWVGKRIVALFLKAFGTSFDEMPDEEAPGKKIYQINNHEKINKIFTAFGFAKDNMLAHNVNLGVLDDDCCIKSFLRGAFLTGGAVTNPEKNYHMEIVTAHYNVSRQTFSLMLEAGFIPKETSRSGHYIIYFKQSASIEDFMTFIGAPVHAMKLMSAKIEKDIRNSVNRKVNCDTANVTKTVDAAGAQIHAIKKIESAGKLTHLADVHRQAAELRLNNPELSIKELGEIANPPVSKSCMYHRMQKLMQVASEI